MITASRLSWLLTPKFVGLLGPSRQQRLHCVCAFCPKICNAWKKEEIDLSSFLSSCRKKKCTEWQRGKITTPELTFHLDALTHSHQSPLENIYTIYLYIHCSLLFWMDLHSSHSEYTHNTDTLLKKNRVHNRNSVKWRGWTHTIIFYCTHWSLLMFAIEFECGKLAKMKWDQSFYFYYSELFLRTHTP